MASDRTFGLVMGLFCAVIGLWPLFRHKPIRWVPIALCAALVLPALLRASLLHPLNRLWTALAVLLNRVVSPAVCGLLFYLVITPVACLFRIWGKDPLRLRPDSQGTTYWISRQPPGPAPESMRVQF